MKNPKFTITKDKKGEFRFNLHATNGQVILSSEGYSSKAACNNGIESVKKNAPNDDRYDLQTAKNGKFYFNLTAANSQVIGSSQMYASASGRSNGIDSVKTNAPSAGVEDLS
ncbi:MAG: YegP family protein [Saprospiraceae bacterium]|nr:YegP family protein [Saprospiraceae bacterium]